MPRIKRWFPVSHDINSDPEVWAMRHEIGEKSLSVWLEFLSIADRNDGEIPGDSEQLIRSVAGRCQATVRTVSAVYQFAISRLWLDSQQPLKVVKYWKYHRPREPSRVPPNPNQSDPIRTNPNRDSFVDKPELSVQDLVDSWNDVFKGKLPAVEWPLSKSRHGKAALRLKEHRTEEFWQRVFDNISGSKFLLGNGNGAWKCTFDFLVVNDTNCLKIFEGSYR